VIEETSFSNAFISILRCITRAIAMELQDAFLLTPALAQARQRVTIVGNLLESCSCSPQSQLPQYPSSAQLAPSTNVFILPRTIPSSQRVNASLHFINHIPEPYQSDANSSHLSRKMCLPIHPIAYHAKKGRTSRCGKHEQEPIPTPSLMRIMQACFILSVKKHNLRPKTFAVGEL